MASLGSFTRFAARATSSAVRRLPIRWRLAGASALLTLTILMGFAAIVGTLTTRRIRADFNQQLRLAANDLQSRLRLGFQNGEIACTAPDLPSYAGAEHAVIRLVTLDDEVLCSTPRAPELGPPVPQVSEIHGYRVEARSAQLLALGEPAVIQYARPISAVNETIARVRVLLVLGVLGGAGLAGLAGLWLGRRAMTPIAELTAAAREIERTRDTSRRLPLPEADDEVAELSRTLDGMLRSLDAARTETEGALARQREFVADASHELRTPLTSVLANLEVLAEQLDGDEQAAAASALRSTRRMRRLVADLLLLARADAGRVAPHSPTDLGAVLVEAAAEVEPLAGDRELTVEADPVMVSGARDELHRLALNLIENALRHTPEGTSVHVSLRRIAEAAVLVVEDDGPGIPTDLRRRVFERFVRAGADSGTSSGLGLAIVQAVAESHGGSVTLETPASGRGARFVVRLPAEREAVTAPIPEPAPATT